MQAPARKKTAGPERRERDPDRTRLALVEAALKLMASDESGQFSVSQVARLAKVNRGTAYFHFASREELVKAAILHASDMISAKLYTDVSDGPARPSFMGERVAKVDEMALFLIQNPQLSRVWLFEVLTKQGGFNDPLTQIVRDSIERAAHSELGQPDVDVDIVTLMTFGAYFLWPLMLKGRGLSPDEQMTMAKRIVTELYRMSLYGSIRPENAPELVATVRKRLANSDKPAPG
ncbi:MAG TPA: TetR/AcrR family transcriptional regulator [Stellaceae bacterium]|nr:TetR/AcrR family transcriptional regulator [Stellaceae bacterium]